MARPPAFTRVRLGGPTPRRRPRPDQHVEPHPDGWAVRADGEESPHYVCPNRNEAFEWAARTARQDKARVIVHRTDGSVVTTLDLSA